MAFSRRLPIGAEVVPGGGAHFRVWAPIRNRVEAVLEAGPGAGTTVSLEPQPDGYFAGLAPQAGPGTRYKYRLDGTGPFPDMASRFQPDGPHGPSEVVDPATFRWTDANWKGCGPQGQVIYELHVGTFTPDGTWAAAADQLAELADLGVTMLEVMPVADFPGRWGWGYDGVDLYAPTRLYGSPDDFRRFVDRAHALGLGVILDVVYNHLGPDGCFHREYSPNYFSTKYKNEWGDPLNFDGPDNGPVREFFVTNAAYWVDEFHLDGLRLDATQQIFDSSPTHILTEVGRAVRAAANGRQTYVVNENEEQTARLVRPEADGGCGLDALWNDDFHHAAMVAATGKAEAYYADYRGTAAEFVAAAKYGYLFQGQRYHWQRKRRGTPAHDLPAWAFVTFTQNHDQVANSGHGKRIHQMTSPGRYKAATALLLLGPGTPMLFQGQEFAASTPFFYFADHNPELGKLVNAGRLEFYKQFRTLARPEVLAVFPLPSDPATFHRCKLDLSERQRHAELYQMHKDLIRLRRTDPAFRPAHPRTMDGATLGERCLVLRFFAGGAGDRLLIVNLGMDLSLRPAPEPLLAPPAGQSWDVLWSTEDLAYGGAGSAPLETDAGWFLPAETAVVLRPRPGAPAPAGQLHG